MLLKFQIFLGSLKFVIFLGVNGRCWLEPTYEEKMRVLPPWAVPLGLSSALGSDGKQNTT